MQLWKHAIADAGQASTAFPLSCRVNSQQRACFQMSRGERPVVLLISEGIPQYSLTAAAGETFATPYLTSLQDLSIKTGLLCLVLQVRWKGFLGYPSNMWCQLALPSDLPLVLKIEDPAGQWGRADAVYLCLLPAPGDCCLLLSPVWTLSSPVGPLRASLYFREVLAVSKLIENVFK